MQTEAVRRAHALVAGGTLNTALPDEIEFIVDRAAGSKIYDLDGREYIDYVLGSGPMLLGHGHPRVVAAVQAQAARGSTYFTLNREALALAEMIVDAVPCAEQVKFVGSGTEATFAALRLARAATGREKIVKFEGAYHGNHDYSLVSVTPSDPPSFPAAAAETAGVPAAVRETVLVAPFNDIEGARDVILDHQDEVAAVIVEPFQRSLPPVPGFLQGLRDVCNRTGAVLIFDEVVTGFRFAWGGAQERYAVTPDLACYGKVVFGGYSGGAVCGRRDLMSLADPAQGKAGVNMTGTLSGNPVSAAAGLATLQEIADRGPSFYEQLFAYGDRLRDGVVTAFRSRRIPVQASGEGPIFQLYLQEQAIRDYRDTLHADAARWNRFCHAMIARGVYFNGGKVYCSAAHTEDDRQATLAACEEALNDLDA
ncbi:MAG: aspartate aminotransferase family protein [Dehalococcoidia bacterium]